MKLTKHGEEHINDRTKMLPHDVLSVISNDAAIPLGTAKRNGRTYEYFLFYSPPNRTTKIAVVSESRTHLVSIWERNYIIPAGIGPITRRHDREAQRILQSYLLNRIKSGERKEAESDKERTLEAKVLVLVDNTIVYQKDAGNIPFRYVDSMEAVISFLVSTLRPICREIESRRRKIRGTIEYVIRIFDMDARKRIRLYNGIGHTTLALLLKTA